MLFEAWGCSESRYVLDIPCFYKDFSPYSESYTYSESCGKDDFMIAVRDDKIWTFGGDEELAAPYPQDNDVWTMELVGVPMAMS